MFRRIGLVPVMAAATILLMACESKPAEAPANDAAPAATEANDTAPSDVNAATTAGTGAGAATGEACGGIAPITCSSDKDYCKIPDGKCGPDAMGTCTVRPEICPDIYKPVCGCDGKDYGNDCEASMAGVSVRSQGKCPKPNG